MTEEDIENHRITPSIRWFLAAVCITAIAAGLLLWSFDNRADELHADREVQDELIAELADGLNLTRDQLEANNIDPVVPDSEVVIREIIREVGERGERGETGAQGEIGETGLQGIQGPRGVQGPPGEDGQDGRDGVDGADGADGQDGAPGPTGPAGPTGNTGPQGPSGPAGPACPPGYEPRTMDTGPYAGWIACAPIDG